MAKISTYALANTPLSLSDRLIGTEAVRVPASKTPLATKNFSLGELLTLFSSEWTGNNLQEVLDQGNSATQSMYLTGQITTTSIKATNIIDTVNNFGNTGQVLSNSGAGISWVYLQYTLQDILDQGNTATQSINLTGTITASTIRPVNITDTLSSNGSVGQVLTKVIGGIQWAATPASTLQAVLTAGNSATNNINLTGTITADNIHLGKIRDSASSYGTSGQILKSQGSASGILWFTPAAATLQSVLDANNAAVQNITLQGLITTTLIKPANIQDFASSIGSVGQVLTRNPAGIVWATPTGGGGSQTLDQVLNVGSDTDHDATFNSLVNIDELKALNIRDYYNSLGTAGQVLSKEVGGFIKWTTPTPGGVTKITAGTNVTISPIGGTGDVTINATGGVQNLQEVTDEGSITTNDISINSLNLYDGAYGGYQNISIGDHSIGFIPSVEAASYPFIISWDSLSASQQYDLPNASGFFALSVNGTTADNTGNIVISNIAGTGHYGQYFSYANQYCTTNNVGKAMIFETPDIYDGITVVSDGTDLTKITFANTGVYNLQFSTQFQNTDNAEQDVYIWLRKNGVTGAADVVGSTGVVAIPKTHGGGSGTPGHTIVSWNFLLDINEGDFYQIVWATASIANVTIQFLNSTANHPSTASTLFTVTEQVAGGSGGSQNLQQVTDAGSTTTNDISVNSVYYYDGANDGYARITNSDRTWNFYDYDGTVTARFDNGSIVLGTGSQTFSISGTNLTAGKQLEAPNFAGGGARTLPISVNGVTANTAGDITIASGALPSFEVDLDGITQYDIEYSGIYTFVNSYEPYNVIAFPDPTLHTGERIIVRNQNPINLSIAAEYTPTYSESGGLVVDFVPQNSTLEVISTGVYWTTICRTATTKKNIDLTSSDYTINDKGTYIVDAAGTGTLIFPAGTSFVGEKITIINKDAVNPAILNVLTTAFIGGSGTYIKNIPPMQTLEVFSDGNWRTISDLRPYRVYTAQLTQEDVNDPIVTVLENTLGYDLTWDCGGNDCVDGDFRFFNSTYFPDENWNKFYVSVSIGGQPNDPTHFYYNAHAWFDKTNKIAGVFAAIFDGTTAGSGQALSGDSTNYPASFEFRIYN